MALSALVDMDRRRPLSQVNGLTVQDPVYKDYDGRKGIRIIDPCTGANENFGPQCQWHDNATYLSMQVERW